MRLETILSMAPQVESAVDVGADHAKVAIELVRRKIATRATATDVGEGPLSRAKLAISACGMSDRVSTRLTDGLTDVEKHDLVVIAGMGGELILHILDTASWTRDDSVTFILQPMTAGERLRAGLFHRGYRVEREEIAREGRKFYPILLVRRGQEQYESLDQLYLSRAADKSPLAKEYVSHVLARMEKQLFGLKAAEEQDAERIRDTEQIIAALQRRSERYDRT